MSSDSHLYRRSHQQQQQQQQQQHQQLYSGQPPHEAPRGTVTHATTNIQGMAAGGGTDNPPVSASAPSASAWDLATDDDEMLSYFLSDGDGPGIEYGIGIADPAHTDDRKTRAVDSTYRPLPAKEDAHVPPTPATHYYRASEPATAPSVSSHPGFASSRYAMGSIPETHYPQAHDRSNPDGHGMPYAPHLPNNHFVSIASATTPSSHPVTDPSAPSPTSAYSPHAPFPAQTQYPGPANGAVNQHNPFPSFTEPKHKPFSTSALQQRYQAPRSHTDMTSHNSFQTINGLSPISPAANIGSAGETLLLPSSSDPNLARQDPVPTSAKSESTEVNQERPTRYSQFPTTAAASASTTLGHAHLPDRVRMAGNSSTADCHSGGMAHVSADTGYVHGTGTVAPNDVPSPSSGIYRIPTPNTMVLPSPVAPAAARTDPARITSPRTTSSAASAPTARTAAQPTPVSHAANPYVFVATHNSAAAAAAAAALNQLHHKAASSLIAAATSQGAVESEEKRAKRLERNRESARKSRRRKKERLTSLEDQVGKLYQRLEKERQHQISTMNSSLIEVNSNTLRSLAQNGDDRLHEKLAGSGLNCTARRAVIEFQWSTLNRTVLQTNQRFLLWLTLQSPAYFQAGKDAYAERERQLNESTPTSNVPRPSSANSNSGGAGSSTKVSSKQIGDELTNGPKLDRALGKSGRKTKRPGRTEKSGLTANASDAAKMWPLTCYELSISVDQEERILNAVNRLQQVGSTGERRSRIAAVVQMTHRLKNAILLHNYLCGMKAQQLFPGVLSPQQSVQYQEWFKLNKDRWSGRVQRDERIGNTGDRNGREATDSRPKSDTDDLIELSRKLEVMLQISQPGTGTIELPAVDRPPSV